MGKILVSVFAGVMVAFLVLGCLAGLLLGFIATAYYTSPFGAWLIWIGGITFLVLVIGVTRETYKSISGEKQ